MIWFFFSLLILLTSTNAIKLKLRSKSDQTIRIAFGSDFSPLNDLNGDIFQEILDTKPDSFLFLGRTLGEQDYSSVEKTKLQYESLSSKPGYSKLKSQTYIDGIEESFEGEDKSLWLDFLNLPANDPRRQENTYYTTFVIESGRRFSVRVILIELIFTSLSFQAAINETQLNWLNKILADSYEDLYIIGTTLPFLPHDRLLFEFIDIHSKIEVLSIIKKHRKPVIFISGNTLNPMGEILNFPCSEEDFGYKIFEVSSSGLTAPKYDYNTELKGRYLIPDTFNEFNNRTFGKNFGLIEIHVSEKSKKSSSVSLKILQKKGVIKVEQFDYYEDFIEKPMQKKKENKLVCTKDLYSKMPNMFKHLWKQDPEMMIYTMFSIFVLIFCLIWCCRNAVKKGGQFAGDEFEKFHQD